MIYGICELQSSIVSLIDPRSRELFTDMISALSVLISSVAESCSVHIPEMGTILFTCVGKGRNSQQLFHMDAAQFGKPARPPVETRY